MKQRVVGADNGQDAKVNYNLTYPESDKARRTTPLTTAGNLISERKKIHGVPVMEFHDSEDTRARPLVLIFHGFTGKKEDHAPHGQALVRAGFAAVSVDVHLHGERGEQPFNPVLLAPRMAEIVRETVDGIDLLIEHYAGCPWADADRVGLLGISLGGSIICHYLPARRPEVRAAVTLISGVHSVWSRVLRNVQTLYPAWGVTDAAIVEAQEVESLPFLEGMHDLPLRVQLGEADPLVPIDDMRVLYANVGAAYADKELFSLLTYPGVGHETPVEMYVRALEWFNRYL
jgi:uncharacterized protein